VNVRCPNCSAVFPASSPSEGGPAQVECPLCLLRFQPQVEQTLSLPQMPVDTRGTAIPSPDDEFESFGAAAQTGIHHTTAIVAGGRPVAAPAPVSPPRAPIALPATPLSPQPTPPPAAAHEDSQTVAAHKASDLQEFGFDGGDIDFDALLSDAVHSVDKKGEGAMARTNPFGRISAPRSGTGGTEEAVFTPPALSAKPLPPLSKRLDMPSGDEDDSLFESGAAALAARTRIDDDLEHQPRLTDNAQRRVPPPRRPQARSNTGRKVARGLATLLLAAGAAGGAAQLAGYGWFGSKLWLKEPPKARADRAVAAELQNPVAMFDTRKGYEAEIRRLEQVVALRPTDKEAKAALLDRLLDLLERAPRAFDTAPEFRKHLDALAAELGAPPRLAVLDLLATDKVVPAEALAPLDQGNVEDREVAVRARLVARDQALAAQALTHPGLTATAEADPLRGTGADEPALQEARKRLDPLLSQAKDRPDAVKFTLLDAVIRDRMLKYDGVVALLEPVTTRSEEQIEARALLASAKLEAGELDPASALAQEAVRLATEQNDLPKLRDALRVVARVEAKRGDRPAMIKALQAVVQAVPSDELTTLRLARLLMADKKSPEAQKLLVAGKKSGMKSVAFEVGLVEYWLSINRNQDALDETTEATRLYPDSIDLLFLRGQVEDKASHFATARDYFEQVIAKEPRHLRAIVRLAELQSVAGKHDDALATLERGRKTVGDDETVLRLSAEELLALKREPEARQLLDILLKAAPQNRFYLLKAAQLDLKTGEVDRALGFLRRLRANKALDREAALQMALALASKKQPDEAAATLTPFADEAQADVELNTRAGQYLIDAKDYDRAKTVLQRAVGTANGKNAEALFQFGRLAFRRGEVDQGISRMQQAIDGDKQAWEYRLELARALFDLKSKDGARDLAVKQLDVILATEGQLQAAGRPVTGLAEVHALLARHFAEQHRYGDAIPHLRAVVKLDPDDADALRQLGMALHATNSPDAPKVLRDLLQRRPGDAQAELYLGLGALNKGQTSEALHWLQLAANSMKPDVAEAWYQLALIYRDRDNPVQAMRAVEQYLRLAKADEPYRADAETLRNALSGGRHK
jgi:tetratricopeptide (TPR) repeat protein